MLGRLAFIKHPIGAEGKNATPERYTERGVAAGRPSRMGIDFGASAG